VAVAGDKLDPELIERPRRWSNRLIRDFMITFGVVSSAFDLLTFGFLLWVLRSDVPQFRTGWFLESVLSEILILLVIRTRRPFFRSPVGRALLVASIVVAAATLLLPWTRVGGAFGLEPIPANALAGLGAIVAAYVVVSEATKRVFFGRVGGVK
jgi:Mg2+-importing ATPase